MREQLLYLPERRENRDIALAAEVLYRSGYSVLWLSWTFRDGPVQTGGPFPYDIMVTRPDEPDGPYSVGGDDVNPFNYDGYPDEGFWPDEQEEDES